MTQSNEGFVMTLPSEKDIHVTYTFNAPRNLVWKAYTQAEHLKNWWGPKGWTLPVCEIDATPGGTWLYCMKEDIPDGMESWGKAIYEEVDEPERLVYTDYFVDSNGDPLEGMPSAHVTVVFTEKDGKTTVTSTSRYPSQQARDAVIEMGMEEGFKETLERLNGYLQTAA